jgi:hypothetical protein
MENISKSEGGGGSSVYNLYSSNDVIGVVTNKSRNVRCAGNVTRMGIDFASSNPICFMCALVPEVLIPLFHLAGCLFGLLGGMFKGYFNMR